MKFVLFVIVLVCLIRLNIGSEYETTVELKIPGIGKVKGELQVAVNDEKYYSYYDIPYAKVQEKGWFKPSIPVSQITDDEVVNPHYRNTCPDWAQTNLDNDEDFRNCLVLKIDSKNIKEKNPVIVFIPGLDLSSGNTISASSFQLMTKDVIHVTIQYRIGAFGFLSTATDEMPGNIGVLDIIDALKWIQKNIEHFGGDNNRITLNGEFLAAGLIGILTASPLADGLFHQVIYQSGSQELEYLATDRPELFSRKVAYELGCTDVLEKDKLNHCFQKANYTEILKAYNTFWKENHKEWYPITVGGPSGVYNWENKPRKYPTLGGFVDQPTIHLLEEYRERTEFSRFSKTFLANEYKLKLEKALQSIEKQKTAIPKGFKELYGEWALEKQFNVTESILDGLIQTILPLQLDISSLHIKLSVVKALLNNFELGGNSYFYIFRYKGKFHNFFSQSENILTNYVTLGDDFQYIYSSKSYNFPDKYISDLMVELWTSFAATGIPTSSEIYDWPKLITSHGPYLIIDKIPYVGFNITRELTPTLDCQKTNGCKWAEL